MAITFIIIVIVVIVIIAIVIVVIIIAADIFIIIFKESVINKSLFKNIHFAVTVKIKKPVIKKIEHISSLGLIVSASLIL